MAQAGGVSPYLTIEGAARAIDFYKAAFGAQEQMQQLADDGQRILHCSLTINGGTVMLSDAFPEHGAHAGPQPGHPSPVAISLSLSERGEVDRIAAQAKEHGASIEMGPADMFWGARFAMLTDPFGHRWMLNAEQPRA